MQESENVISTDQELVEPQRYRFEQPFEMSSGMELEKVELVYQTYGELNSEKSNAILICHALNGSHHVSGKNHEDGELGWWNQIVGPDKAIDTNKYFVVCPNNIGGCHGSTGPNTINAETGVFWGADFPRIRIRDWVRSQKRLQEHLGIEQWLAVVGGSLGGMQAMRWSIDYPDALRKCVVLASTMYLDAQNIAFNEIARKAILMDPDFMAGDYLNQQRRPIKGLAVARMISNMSCNSEENFKNRFGRLLRSGDFTFGDEEDVLFEVESYVNYKAEKFATAFDANSYILMTKMLDLFDLRREFDDAIVAFGAAQCRFLVASFSSDWRFPPKRSCEIAYALMQARKKVTYCNLSSKLGDDAFLIAEQNYQNLMQSFLQAP